MYVCDKIASEIVFQNTVVLKCSEKEKQLRIIARIMGAVAIVHTSIISCRYHL